MGDADHWSLSVKHMRRVLKAAMSQKSLRITVSILIQKKFRQRTRALWNVLVRFFFAFKEEKHGFKNQIDRR